MTEAQAALTLYRDILLIMALIVFTANQTGILIREISLDMTLRRARKLAFGQITGKRKAKPQKLPREWNAPTFKWQWMWYVLGVLGILLLIYVAVGIILYDPSGGRG